VGRKGWEDSVDEERVLHAGVVPFPLAPASLQVQLGGFFRGRNVFLPMVVDSWALRRVKDFVLGPKPSKLFYDGGRQVLMEHIGVRNHPLAAVRRLYIAEQEEFARALRCGYHELVVGLDCVCRVVVATRAHHGGYCGRGHGPTLHEVTAIVGRLQRLKLTTDTEIPFGEVISNIDACI